MGEVVRPLGLLEKLYAARQVLGIYNSVIITATLKSRPNHLPQPKSLQSFFHTAISELVNQHPPLRCYIDGLDTPLPKFKALDPLALDDVVQIDELSVSCDVAEKLQTLHDQQWSSNAKPLWKLVVLQEHHVISDEPTASALHLAFVYHHALGDGLSGIAVMKSLIKILQTTMHHDAEENNASDILLTPEPVTLIEPVEKLVNLPISWSFLLRQVMNEYGPRWLLGTRLQPWAALPVQNLEQRPLRSRIKIVTIHANDVVRLLGLCRKHGATLTSLLTAATVSTLAIALPEASSFTGLTPYTLRHLTGTPVDVMANQISAFETEYPLDTLDTIRAASTSEEHAESLWKIASQFHGQMRDRLAQCPQDDVIGLLPYISDSVNFYRKKFGKPREATFEVSNLGVVPGTSSARTWELESMTFTQGAQPVASAFSVNCVSVKDGPLTLAITWQDGVVEERIIDAVAESLGNLATAFA
ncbi:MAG: hypothetical protein Q9170_002390 [Blastenia crenularia]